jgi:hypothetical protein
MRFTLDLRNTGGRRLQDVVSRGQMALLANLQAHGKTLPRLVTQWIESFIASGDPRHGFSPAYSLKVNAEVVIGAAVVRVCAAGS